MQLIFPVFDARDPVLLLHRRVQPLLTEAVKGPNSLDTSLQEAAGTSITGPDRWLPASTRLKAAARIGNFIVNDYRGQTFLEIWNSEEEEALLAP